MIHTVLTMNFRSVYLPSCANGVGEGRELPAVLKCSPHTATMQLVYNYTLLFVSRAVQGSTVLSKHSDIKRQLEVTKKFTPFCSHLKNNILHMSEYSLNQETTLI